MRPKLKKDNITFAEIYILSKQVYYKEQDDKERRMKMDIVSARMTRTQHFEFDKNVGKWVQDKTKRHTRFDFIVSSKPISYKKIDDVPVHRYPVSFVFYDVNLGFNSPFRWRTGSFKKVLFARKGASEHERVRVANHNILNGKQLDFFFKLEALLANYGLLYGPDTTNHKLPTKANPTLTPYFDKTALFCVEKVLRYVLTDKGITKINSTIK